MEKMEFTCRDVGIDCDERMEGSSEDEIMRKAEMHGREKHGIEKITDEMKNKIRSAIHRSQAA